MNSISCLNLAAFSCSWGLKLNKNVCCLSFLQVDDHLMHCTKSLTFGICATSRSEYLFFKTVLKEGKYIVQETKLLS